MTGITIVTGPMRSGTSCVTGFLELCGFDLGRNIRVLRNETSMNPKGHFELDLLFTINERLLVESGPGNGVFTPPKTREIRELAAQRDKYFSLFLKKFDGNLCKDPLFCLTLGAWKNYWPQLQRVVFCLRNPLSVALSMQARYGFSVDYGIRLWDLYTSSFLDNATGLNVFIVDFDRLCREPLAAFSNLLQWLECPLDSETLKQHIHSFFVPPRSSANSVAHLVELIPKQTLNVYKFLSFEAEHLSPQKEDEKFFKDTERYKS